MGNLDLWNKVDDIDPKFTKAITGRDYQGTSPNPQYLIKLATEHLGPVGKGFGWEVLADGFERLGDTVLHWCRIRFWWKDDEGEHGVEEYGQTKAAFTTAKGYARVDEDAPKKSLTDAVVKGLSHLGFAANIFLGRWDDQKYVAQVREEYRAAEFDHAPPPVDAPKDHPPEVSIGMSLDSAQSEEALLTVIEGIFRTWGQSGWPPPVVEKSRGACERLGLDMKKVGLKVRARLAEKHSTGEAA